MTVVQPRFVVRRIFTARAENIELWKNIEDKFPLIYWKSRLYNVGEEYEFSKSVIDMPEFGVSTFGSRNLDARYVVLPPGRRPLSQRVANQEDISLSLNYEGLDLICGGDFNGIALLPSEISCVADSEFGMKIIKYIDKKTRLWVKKNSYKFSPGCVSAYKLGMRLTANVESPAAYNFVI